MNDYFLLHVYPMILAVIFLAWALLAVLNWGSISAPFKTLVSAHGWAGVLILMLASLIVRPAFLPARHQVYFDEFIHENVAANIAHDGTFGESLAGGSDEIRMLQVPAWPGGYHVLLGSVFKIFGFSESAAFHFNGALGAGAVLMIFLLTTLLFKDQVAGFCAAFFLAALPIHIRFSGAADLTTCSEFWVLVSLLALALHLELQVLASYVLLLLSLVYA